MNKKTKKIILLVLLILIVGTVGLSFKEGSYVDLKFDQIAAVSKIKSDPNNPDLYIAAGIPSYGLKEYAKAEEYYLKSISIKESSTAYNNLGNTYREMLRTVDAEKNYLKAIAISPANVTPYLNLANLYKNWPDQEVDKKPEIEKLLNDGLAKTDRNINLLYALVDHYRSVGNDATADKLQEEINQKQV